MTPRPAKHLVALFLRATGYEGVTLPPWGIYILPQHLASDRLIRHEQCHWAQYQRMGAVRFYAKYIWLLLRHGYQNHPMEKEAREAECRST